MYNLFPAELLAKLKEPRMEYHVRLRFRCSGFAFQMKSRICILLCSFVVQNLNIFFQLFNKAIRPAAAAAIYFFQRFAARMCRRFSK